MTSTNASIPARHDLWRAGPRELVEHLKARVREQNRLAAEIGWLVTEIEARGAQATFGYGSTLALLDTLDPDGPEPKDPDPHKPTRELHFQQHRDGTASMTAKLDAVTYAHVRALVNPSRSRKTVHTPTPAKAHVSAAA